MPRKKADPPEDLRSPQEIEDAYNAIERRDAEIEDEAAKCRESLKYFIVKAWPLIGMGRPFVDGWHIDCFCEHMEAVLRRQIRKLILNVSPRSAKSSVISVGAPAWWWIIDPKEHFLSSSYTTKLSLRDSRFNRNLVQSPWYKERFGKIFQMTKDQAEKGRFENDKGGIRIATAMDSTTTGEGGACLSYSCEIVTEQGYIPIGDIVESQRRVRVWTSAGELREIEAFSKTAYSGKTIRISAANGANIVCTPNHPVFCVEYNSFIAAAEMRVGYQVLLVSDSGRLAEPVLVDAVDEAYLIGSVYNIQVASEHDYYADGILTHNCRIYDDLNDLNTINSKTERQNAIDYYQVCSTRAVDPKTDVELCIQQRGHPDDITGYLLSLGGWEHVVIPMEYEGPRPASSIGWVDPRTKVGELMHADRFGPLELEQLKKTLGPKYEGQFQQRPAVLAGNILKRENWNFWNPDPLTLSEQEKFAAERPILLQVGSGTVEKKAVTVPSTFEQVVQSWDAAFKDLEDNDYVAGHVWGRVAANCYLIGRSHGHKDFPETVRAVREMSLQFPCPEKLVEEKANGAAVIQCLRNEIPGLIAVNDAGGKVARVSAISGYVQAGNVFLPNPNLYQWVWEYLNETSDFPSVEHDDDVDAMSQALGYMYNSLANHAFPEFRVSPRVGEPATAKHIEPGVAQGLLPYWRRWVAISPGAPGCALWLCETPAGGIRIYRELDLTGLDAVGVGKAIARESLPDIERYVGSMHKTARWSINLLFEAEAFAPIEPVGSYAELVEQGIADFQITEGEYDERAYRQSLLKVAKFSSDRVTLEESSMDRFRDLLKFQPPNFQVQEWDRKKALALANSNNPEAYRIYVNAVEGKVTGEFPRLKMDAGCVNLAQALGSAMRGLDTPNPFLRCALIGTSQSPEPQKSGTLKQIIPESSVKTHKGVGRRFAGGRF
jgi:predicted phage terminase large subunit-like protein